MHSVLLDVTAFIGTIGNSRGLALTLQSVINQSAKPSQLVVFDCSETLVMQDFYVQQLLQVAVVEGIEPHVVYAGKLPLDRMYSKMLTFKGGPLKWYCNDDVFYHHKCLETLASVLTLSGAAVVCGTKPDITNQRGYADWSRRAREHVADGSPPYAFYARWTGDAVRSVRRRHMDMGNALVDADQVLAAKLNFDVHTNKDVGTTFGEDWVFGARCQAAGLTTLMCPQAQSYHLDKPSGSPFGTFKTQRDLLEERLDGEGLPKGVLAEWGASK